MFQTGAILLFSRLKILFSKMSLPVKAESYTFYVSLVDISDPDNFKVNPTIAAGDFQISIDDAVFTNLTNLPSVTPANSIQVKIVLTATEMNGDKINVQGIDAAGNEWQDAYIAIDVPRGSVETLFDIDEGDRTESNTRLTIKRKGTDIILIDKEITGSLLDNEITLRTTETA